MVMTVDTCNSSVGKVCLVDFVGSVIKITSSKTIQNILKNPIYSLGNFLLKHD